MKPTNCLRECKYVIRMLNPSCLAHCSTKSVLYTHRRWIENLESFCDRLVTQRMTLCNNEPVYRRRQKVQRGFLGHNKQRWQRPLFEFQADNSLHPYDFGNLKSKSNDSHKPQRARIATSSNRCQLFKYGHYMGSKANRNRSLRSRETKQLSSRTKGSSTPAGYSEGKAVRIIHRSW